MNRTLRAVARNDVTAQEAITWWCTAAQGTTGRPVGFGFSATAATWWRVTDGIPTTPKEPADLTGVYELVGFDGDRELRWRNEDAGHGTAVVLADLPELLPPGDCDISPKAVATPLGDPQPRILAGQVRRHENPGWVRLTAARYAPAEIPVSPDPGIDLDAKGKDTPLVVLDSVEYAAEDRHGNVSVVDRRLVRLRILRHEELRLYLPKEG